jgi:phage terminase large subunit
MNAVRDIIDATEVKLAFDYLKPDYTTIWQARVSKLAKMRNPDPDPLTGITGPEYLQALRLYYPLHKADFIQDWGVTVDPRNVGSSRPILMPFVLFPKQRDFIAFVDEGLVMSQHGSGDGILVKSRDCGASWLAMAYAVTLCLFYHNMTVGFGSAKEDKVDRSGDPTCLFYKGRQFLRYLPREFRGSWSPKKHTAHMRIELPDTEGAIIGEAGDNMGVGGRAALYFVDEAALVERPKLVDAALSNVTRCRIEMSSVRGIDNVFAQRARGGKIRRFDFHYSYDPRKVNLTGNVRTIQHVNKKGVVRQVEVKPGDKYPDFQEFYDNMDVAIRNQEMECDFLASISGGVIEAVWIQAAVGAAEKLGIKPTGDRCASFDVADLGSDMNSVTIRHGIECLHAEEWSGSNINPMISIRHAFDICDRYNTKRLKYDASGMGGTWHEYFALVNKERRDRAAKKGCTTCAAVTMTCELHEIEVEKFQGGAAVMDPENIAPGTDRTNEDYFENLKAQCWMTLRIRFMETYKAIAGEDYDRENIISISPSIEIRDKLISELAQPTRKWSKNGKLMIDKTPDGVASPNNADSVMQNFGYSRPSLEFSDDLLEHL